jgi:DNA-binding NarL/FixJ family response regulator
MNVKKSAMPSNSPSQEDPEDARRLRIVIVEDEPILAMELETLLEELDVEIVGIASSGAEAEVLVQTARPDCMTMDVNINGDRDGLCTAQDIFERFGIRSIFVSASSDAAMQKRAEQCHAIGWIRKPVEKLKLVEALESAKRSAG